jgi:hypothetical protein
MNTSHSSDGLKVGFVKYNIPKTVDGTTFTVVAEVKNNECWLITGLYE